MEFDLKKNLKDIVLSVLFVAGEGIEKSFIAQKLGVSEKEIDKVLDELQKEFSGDCGIHLLHFNNKVPLASNPVFGDAIGQVLNPIREKALTRAALETLAIIAYKQPITKLEIEDIRRVGCDYAIQVLSEQNMIEVVGRKDAVGKPLLFGTTENFLKRFNLTDLAQLPDYDGLLERIKVIEEGEEEQNDTLYSHSQLPEEEIPDFLKNEENLQSIS